MAVGTVKAGMEAVLDLVCLCLGIARAGDGVQAGQADPVMQCFPVCGCAPSLPRCLAVYQDALYGSSVTGSFFPSCSS